MDPVTLFSVLVLIIVFYLYLNRNRSYWKNRDVPELRPVPVLGNLKPLVFLEKSPGPFLADLYNSVPAVGQPFLGFYLFNCQPALLIRDPELVKRVLVQDFDHFHNRNVDCNPSCDPIGVRNLFVVRGPKWKYLRTKLTPTFTTGKLKQMFLEMREVASELCRFIAEAKASAIECKEVLAKYTTDVITICAFGIRANSLSDPASEFRHFGRKIFNTSAKRSLETRSFFFMHCIAKTFRFVFFEKDGSEFMRNVFAEALSVREKSAVSRNDFVDILVKLKKDLEAMREAEDSPAELSELDEESVIAQAALFYTAGFETTTVTIMATLYELALQPELQSRIREEIVRALEDTDGLLEYDSFAKMKTLDTAVSETLRKYPPMPFVDRVCTKDYKLPDYDLTIKKGTPIFIPLYRGLHYDADLFPDPENYDPDRFGDERKSSIRPYSYVPFGEGPRICLGMRFGIINTKTAIASILSKFEVATCEKTRYPMEMDDRSIILSPEGGLHLKFLPLH